MLRTALRARSFAGALALAVSSVAGVLAAAAALAPPALRLGPRGRRAAPGVEPAARAPTAVPAGQALPR